MKIKKIICVAISIICLTTITNICGAADFLGDNIVLNESFENGIDGWMNWEGNCAIATETAHQGSKSIKIWANTTGDNEQLLQDVKVKPGETYEFSAWMRVPSGQSARCSLLLTATGYTQENLSTMWLSYNTNEKDPLFMPNKVNGSEGDGHTIWKEMTTTVTVPDSEDFPNYNENDINTYPNICIYFQYTSGGNWNRYLYIDDVTLQQVYSKSNVVNGVKFYQNGIEITDSGFNAGIVVAEFSIERVKVHGQIPSAIIVAYNGNKMLAYNGASV